MVGDRFGVEPPHPAGLLGTANIERGDDLDQGLGVLGDTGSTIWVTLPRKACNWPADNRPPTAASATHS